MIYDYKEKMMAFITSNLTKLENEKSISEFIEEYYLPFSIQVEVIRSVAFIPDPIWDKINLIQIKGGKNFMINQVEILEKKNTQLVECLCQILQSIRNEEEQDNECRKTYGNYWQRRASNSLNVKYHQIILDYMSIKYHFFIIIYLLDYF